MAKQHNRFRYETTIITMNKARSISRIASFCCRARYRCRCQWFGSITLLSLSAYPFILCKLTIALLKRLFYCSPSRLSANTNNLAKRHCDTKAKYQYIARIFAWCALVYEKAIQTLQKVLKKKSSAPPTPSHTSVSHLLLWHFIQISTFR